MNNIIKINQAAVVESGLSAKTDLIDWAIVDYLKDWHSAKKKRTIKVGSEQFIWVNFNYLMKSMPLLHIKEKNAISKRFKKLRDLGLIKTYRAPENTLYALLTQTCLDILSWKNPKDNDAPCTQIETVKKENEGDNIQNKDIPHYVQVAKKICDYWNCKRLERSADSAIPERQLDRNFINLMFVLMNHYGLTAEKFYEAIDGYFILYRSAREKAHKLDTVIVAGNSIMKKLQRLKLQP